MTQTQKGSFPLGQVVITRTAEAKLNVIDIIAALKRHAHGDCGDVSLADSKINETAIREGFRVLSAYRDREGTRFWIITEADRSATTILLPEEY